MKTLIINGSPREHGDSKYITEKLKTRLSGEVHTIDVYKEKYSPCIDCRYCWTKQGCQINDDLQKTYSMIETFDNIVLSSPIYFSEIAGPLLSYTSRFQRYYAEKYIMKNQEFNLKSKKGIIVLSAGGDCRTIERLLKQQK